MALPWKDKSISPPEGEELVVYYEIFGVGGYIPTKTIDRGVKKWISLKEINEHYGINWSAEEHCAALN